MENMKKAVRHGGVRHAAVAAFAAAVMVFPIKEISLMAEVFGKERPPIDREVPSRLETAIFALG